MHRLALEMVQAKKGQRNSIILTKANAAGYLVRASSVSREQATKVLQEAVDHMDFSPEERRKEYQTVERGIEHALQDEQCEVTSACSPKLGENALVDMLPESYGEGNLVSDGGGLWKWTEEGVWRPAPIAELKQRMCKILGKNASNGLVKNAAELAIYKLYSSEFAARQVPVFINCRNGELWWEDSHWRFYPQHRRERFATTQIPVKYDPTASCPVFDEYLATTLGDDEAGCQKRQLLLEMTGYTLLPTCELQKFAMLYGVPASGKSAYLDLLGVLVGSSSQTTIPLSGLTKDTNIADLPGKLLHSVGDLDTRKKIPVGLVKSLSSGDMLSARWLYGKPFNFNPTSTIWLATNALPAVHDFTGLERRVALIEFPRPVPRERQDYQLLDKFKGELSGILNKALSAFGEVLKRKGVFTEVADSNALFELWSESSDDLRAFVNECCKEGTEFSVASGKLHEAYCLWAKRANVQFPLSRNKLPIALKEICNAQTCRSGGTRKIKGLALRAGCSGEELWEVC